MTPTPDVRDDLAEWLLRTVGTASTLQSAKRCVEKLVADAIAAPVHVDAVGVGPEGREALQRIAAYALHLDDVADTTERFRSGVEEIRQIASIALSACPVPDECPTCGKTGPDSRHKDFDTGMWECECGDEWHDDQPVPDEELRERVADVIQGSLTVPNEGMSDVEVYYFAACAVLAFLGLEGPVPDEGEPYMHDQYGRPVYRPVPDVPEGSELEDAARLIDAVVAELPPSDKKQATDLACASTRIRNVSRALGRSPENHG